MKHREAVDFDIALHKTQFRALLPTPHDRASRAAELVSLTGIAIIGLLSGLRGQYYVEAPRVNIPLQRSSYGGITPDLDASGVPDYMSFGVGNSIYVWLDPGITGPGAPLTITLTGVPPNVSTGYSSNAFAMVTRDAQIDMLGIDNSIGTVRLLAGISTPPFFVPQTTTIGGPNNLFCSYADVNGDGWIDLIRAQSGPMGAAPYNIIVYVNNYPQWPISSQFLTPRRPLGAVSGDFDGDGNRDLAVVLDGIFGVSANPALDEIVLYFGDGFGNFSGPVFQSGAFLAPLSQSPPSFAVRDIDGDGCTDIYRVTAGNIGSTTPASLRVIWGSPTRVFSGTSILTVPGANGYQQPEFMDIDGDGFDDFGFRDANSSQNHFYRILHNHGDRTFGSETHTLSVSLIGNIGASFYPVFTRADFDLDGDLDMMGHSPTQVHYYINEAVYARGCAGTGGKVPRSTPGTAFLGSQGTAFYLEDALPQAPALFGISVARNPLGVFPCGIGIDFFGASAFIPRMTDAVGFAAVPITIPGWSGLQGAQFSIQWAVADPSGGFTGSTTNIALSEARTVYIW